MEYLDRREESISRSCEGSDIVFENLLGDLISRTDRTATRQCTDDIDDIFDDDLFGVSKDEMEKHSIYLLTDVDDEEESESVEGLPPDVTTSPIKPQIDVFDSILLDLDEKTKEMEKLELTRKESRKHKRKRRRKQRRSETTADSLRCCLEDEYDANRHLICCQNEGDLQMVHREQDKGEVLNPWRLREWEFDGRHHRRTLRTLLATLNRDILWDALIDEKQWEPVKRKDIVYEKECLAVLRTALSVFHCDKSRQRGDTISQQIVCEWISQALSKAAQSMRGKAQRTTT